MNFRRLHSSAKPPRALLKNWKPNLINESSILPIWKQNTATHNRWLRNFSRNLKRSKAQRMSKKAAYRSNSVLSPTPKSCSGEEIVPTNADFLGFGKEIRRSRKFNHQT